QTTQEDRLQRLEKRLEDLDRRHRKELAARDEEIRGLKARVGDGASGPATAPAGQPAPAGPPDAAGRERDLLGEIDAAGTASGTPNAAGAAPDQTARDVARDAAGRGGPLTLSRGPVSFNPDLAVVSDFLGSYSTNRDNGALNRLDVREVELDLRAAVDPRADAVAVLAFARDVDNPVFPTGERPEGPDASVDVEEAYLFLHDFGVPNLTAKLGRFHVRFGRQNILHLHDLPTSDPSFVQQAFLAPEALGDSGLSLSYVVPPRLVGNQYVELVGEVLAGEGAGTESPTLRGDLSVDSPAFNTHVLWNTDLSKAWNLEVGASWLTGSQDADSAHRLNLYGGDVTLIRTDPTGRFFNQLFQAEVMYADGYDPDGARRNGWGAYALGQQQLDRDWYAGVRLDYLQNPNAAGHPEAWGVSPYVSYYLSEFLRLRAEFQHKGGDVPEENNVYVQATWIFGAHPPHPYWAMR
ncbi:MAG: hypothetical protein JWO31_3622, partial [Phycisphaerales bacterium]|nr:hypothetical protein [Phycisphaerales bacterium]